MAGPYYVDIGTQGAWNTRDGLSSGACWYGATGLQKAFDTAVVGEIVYIKGTCDLSKNYTVPYDANVGNLTDGEAVTWHDGAGVVHFAGAMATPLQIELTSGNICSDGDTVTGSTSGNTVTAHVTIAQYTIDINTNTGGTTTGFITYIGVNALWTRDGTRAIVNVNGANIRGLTYSGVLNGLWFENIEVKSCGGTRSGFYLGSVSSSLVFVNCCGNSNGGSGFEGSPGGVFARCVAYGNTDCGFNSSGSGHTAFIFCCARDNGADGFKGYSTGTDVFLGCLAYDNGDDGFSNIYAFLMAFCVSNGNADDGVEMATGASGYIHLLVGNRITNHSGVGDIGLNASSKMVLTLGNYFEDNDGNNIQNDSRHYNISIVGAGTTSNVEDQANVNEGYVNLVDGAQDFNLRSDASLRRLSVPIPTI